MELIHVVIQPYFLLIIKGLHPDSNLHTEWIKELNLRMRINLMTLAMNAGELFHALYFRLICGNLWDQQNAAYWRHSTRVMWGL